MLTLKECGSRENALVSSVVCKKSPFLSAHFSKPLSLTLSTMILQDISSIFNNCRRRFYQNLFSLSNEQISYVLKTRKINLKELVKLLNKISCRKLTWVEQIFNPVIFLQFIRLLNPCL